MYCRYRLNSLHINTSIYISVGHKFEKEQKETMPPKGTKTSTAAKKRPHEASFQKNEGTARSEMQHLKASPR